MRFYIILLFFLFNPNFDIIGTNIVNNNTPREIKHGILDNDFWSSNTEYEYYINITEYKLNEENIFELYSKEDDRIIKSIKIYTLLTNATIKEILNNKINPTSEDQYIKTENSYKLDFSTGITYFFMPFKKINIDQKYFLIKIIIDDENINQNVYYSISNRIPTFYLNFTNNNSILFSGNLKSRDDIHLYYKFELDKNIK